MSGPNTPPNSANAIAPPPVGDGAIQSLEQTFGRIKTMFAEAEALRDRLQNQQQALSGQEAELLARHTRVAELEAAAREHESRLAADRQAVESLASQVQSEEARIRAERDKLQELHQQIARQRDEFGNDKRDVERILADISRRESDLAKRQAELDSRAAAAVQSFGELTTLREQLRDQSAQAAAVHQEVATLRSALEAVARERDSASGESRDATSRVKELATQLDALREQLDAQRRVSDETTRTALARESELREQAARLNAELAKAARAGEEAATLRQQVAELSRRAEQAAGADKAARELREQVTTLTRQLEQALRDAKTAREQYAGHESDVEKLAAVLEQLKERLDQETTRTQLLSTQLKKAEERIAELTDQSRGAAQAHALANPLSSDSAADELREQVAALTRELAEARTGPAPAAAPARDQSTAARRVRLRRARDMIRDRAQKIRKASEVLSKRFEQCEQVLSQRQDVLASKRAVEAAHRRVQLSDGRSKAASSIFYVVCAAAVLAFLSWTLAGQFGPGQFVAKAVLSAENRDRPLNDGELDEWRQFHADMLADPRFLQFAATRLDQQGFKNMATAPALKDRLTRDLTVAFPNSGEMTLELKGDGPTRTERELQALTIAIQSQAREARDRRIDGAVTLIRDQAKAGEAPIDDTRLVYAGGIFGIGVAASLILGLFVWRRLALAKLRFEQSTSLEALEAAERWPEMQQSSRAAA